jgi:cytochrome P450
MTQTLDLPVYDPRDDSTRRNPFPLYARLQEEDPVHWSPALKSWVLTRYDDVRQVCMGQSVSSDRLRPFYESLKDERRDILSGVMRYLNHWLVFQAPPEHTRLRRLLNTVVSAATVAEMGPAIRDAFEHVLRGVDTGREIDFMKEVAELFPAFVILDMLGAPREDFRAIKAWSDDLRLFIGTAQGEADKYQRARDGADRMSAYFRELIALRRRQPGRDAISRMVLARDEGGMLNEDELVACCMLFLFGGHETTTNLLGSAVVALLAHPEQLARLHAEPALIDAAVEEFLRYDGPTNSVARVVTQDHALGGKTLRAGERVFAMINAANRDPRHFSQPQQLELARTPNRHLTFGFGIHFCLGAPLARLEAKVCLGELAARFARMRAGSEPTQWIDSLTMRGPKRLPLVLA